MNLLNDCLDTAAGILHRDIKSANVLASIQHGRRVAKLADFGSARSAGPNLTASAGNDVLPDALSPPCTLSRTQTLEPQAADAAGPPPDAQLPSATATRGLGMHAGILSLRDSLEEAPTGQSAPGFPLADAAAELCVRPKEGRGGFVCPLTRAICTPCYKAPEMMISVTYGSGIDIWGLGKFLELAGVIFVCQYRICISQPHRAVIAGPKRLAI